MPSLVPEADGCEEQRQGEAGHHRSGAPLTALPSRARSCPEARARPLTDVTWPDERQPRPAPLRDRPISAERPASLRPEFVLGGCVDYGPRDLRVGTAKVEHLECSEEEQRQYQGPDQLLPPGVHPAGLVRE